MNDDDEIAEAYAVQEVSPPKWTSDPPTEPGWYWAHDGRDAEAFKVVWETTRLPPVLAWVDHDGCYWTLANYCDGWLWWPAAIQPPEAP